MKRKNTLRALLTSVLALVLCCSMLAGTTFAWFTDSASTGVNTIVAGNLDIELSYQNVTMSAFEEVTPTTDDLFVNAEGNDILWEPGAAAVTYLKVENTGSLALTYKLAALVKDTVTGTDGAALSKVLKTAVVEISEDNVGTYTNTNAIAAATDAGATGILNYSKEAAMLAGDTLYLAMVVYFPSEIGNTHDGLLYNTDAKLQCELSLSLFATQTPSEKDSFGDQYDAAAAASIPVSDTAGFGEAVKDVADNGTIDITADMTITGSNGGDLNNTDKTTNVNLNGNTVTAATGNAGFGVRNNAVANISNGTLVADANTYSAVLARYQGAVANVSDMTISNSKDNGTALCARDSGVINVEDTVINSTVGGCADANAGTINIKNCTFTQTGGTDAADDYRNTLFIACFGGVINIDGGDYTGANKGLYIITSGGKFNVYDGNFKADEVIRADHTNYENSYPGATAVFNIYGGNFEGKIVVPGVSGNTVNIVAGTFTNTGLTLEQFKAYVAVGSTVIANGSAFVVTKNN